MTHHDQEPRELELEGIYAGLAAGAVLAVSEAVVAAARGSGFATPLIAAASVIMREHAFAAPASLVLPVGVAVHGCIAALWGYFFGLVAGDDGAESPYRLARQLVAGIVMGTFIWALDLKIFARLLEPAVARAVSYAAAGEALAGESARGDGAQLLLHALVFGAPMGLVFAYLERPSRRRARPSS